MLTNACRSCHLLAETAYDTINAVAKTGSLHLVDLAPQLHASSAGTVQAAVEADMQHTPAFLAAQEQYKAYKKRLADCVLWERQLQRYVLLRQSYPSIPKLPIIDGGDVIHEVEIRSADLLESLESEFNPFEAQLVFNASFQKEGIQTLETLRERRWVVEMMHGLNLNNEVAKLHGQVAGQSGHSAAISAILSVATPELFAVACKVRVHQRSPKTSMAVQRRKSHSVSLHQHLVQPLASPLPLEIVSNRSLCGTLPIENQQSLSRMLYRLSRGNALVRFSDDAASTDGQSCGLKEESRFQLSSATAVPSDTKVVFYVLFLGTHLAPRITKLVELSGGTMYELPAAARQVEDALRSCGGAARR